VRDPQQQRNPESDTAEPPSRAAPELRTNFQCFVPVTPRWNDNDVFGHINNAEYYAYFDTAVMNFMVRSGVVSITGGRLGTVVAETGCRFHREIVFTDDIAVGLCVDHIGRSSVRYRIGILRNNDVQAAADGHFVHVFIDRAEKRPIPIPDDVRTVLGRIRAEASDGKPQRHAYSTTG
jgi:acyl-CoA thioester hydrolase